MALTELESRLLEAVEKMRKELIEREEQWVKDRALILERINGFEEKLSVLASSAGERADK
jgi:hypothetical protein